MLVLGLDTSGPDCSVSIVDEATVRANISRIIGRGHAEVLAGMVADAFEAAGLTPSDIDRLAVCTGPGSFTGLRVALSFALGFALPRDLPVIGVNALALTHMQSTPEGSPPALIYKDVRRDEVMFGVYNGPQFVRGGEPRTDTNLKMKQAAEHFRVSSVEVSNIDTRILAWLAMDLDPASYPPEPLYARGPDAKLPGGKSLADRLS